MTSTSWPTVRLGEVAEFKYGRSLPKQKRTGRGYPVFGSNGEVGRHEDSLTAGPTVIVGRKGSFGEVAFSEEPCWPIDTTYYIDRESTDADLRWLYYRLRNLPLTRLNRAAAIPGLNREDAYAQTLLLPPIEEQRRIAAVLDAADALRAKRRQAIAKLDTLTQAIFIDMFGEHVRGVLPLETYFSERPVFGTMIPGGSTGEWLDLRVGNIQDGRIDLSDRKYVDLECKNVAKHSVRDGDILMARAIATQGHLGKCIVARPGKAKWAYDSHLMRIRLDTTLMLPEFLQTWLSTPYGRSEFLKVTRRSSVQFNVNTKEISRLNVPSVDIESQTRFRNALERVNSFESDLEAHSAHLDSLFASLQQRAFRGEL